ncbi:MAG: hypothetical protein QG675_369 [Patescibacteria group bacterium]|jgi:hypothetical protein|nr:hypothetical protein [Patescibacteria group bacterium]
MVSVRTHQKKALTEGTDTRAESLHKYLGYLIAEFNSTVDDLRNLGFDASISVSDDGAAPGN